MHTQTNMVFLLVALLGAASLSAGNASPQDTKLGPQAHQNPAYHAHPPNAPLPATLDPGQFAEDHSALVAYSLAAKIKETLYQVPCYCGCAKQHGHESLLDCFTGLHGKRCRMCQKEAVFCFTRRQKGKSPARIRRELAAGKAWKIDLTKEVELLYARIHEAADP